MSLRREVKTPGEMLQEARENRVMTIEQLSGITKIPERLLRALESDEHHKLSGPLYVKSFLRTYAGALGLDPHEIVAVYETQADLSAPASAAVPGGAGIGKLPPVAVASPGNEAPSGSMTESNAAAPPAAAPSAAAPPPSFEAGSGTPISDFTESTIALEVEVQRVGIAYGRLLVRGGLIVIVLAVLAIVVWLLVTGKLGSGSDDADSAAMRPAVESLLTAAEDLPPTAVTDEASVASGDAPHRDPLQQPESDFEVASEVDGGVRSAAEITDDGSSRLAPGTASRRRGSTTITAEQMLASADRLAGAWMSAGRPEFPSARRGDRRVDFRDLGARDLVLRLVCQQPVSIRVAMDSGTAQPVAWPPVDRIGRLPASRIEAGEPYTVRQGLAVYWGARERFSILLGRAEGIELTLNGVPLAPESLPLGEEIVLDASSVPAGAGDASGP